VIHTRERDQQNAHFFSLNF